MPAAGSRTRARPPDDDRLNLALLGLHARRHGPRTVLADAERSLAAFEQRLVEHRARLRALGYTGV